MAPLTENQKQIKANKYDFFYVREVCDRKKAYNKFDKDHFLDVNYPRFLNFMLKAKDNYKTAKFLQENEYDLFSIKPQDLIILGENEPFDVCFLDDDEGKVFVYSTELKRILKCRQYGSFQKKAYDIITRFPDAERFDKRSFDPEYIDVFESMLNELYENRQFSKTSITRSFFDFSPKFFGFVRDHIEEIVDKRCFDNGHAIYKQHIVLSSLGEDLLAISRELSNELAFYEARNKEFIDNKLFKYD